MRTSSSIHLPRGSVPWDAPACVYSTLRCGGVSKANYAANNLGLHVGDEPSAVRANRRLLSEELSEFGVAKIVWLDQVHGSACVRVRSPAVSGAAIDIETPVADASWTTEKGVALAILSADCVPVMLADINGSFVAAAHAGWRGLCAGVLAELVGELPVVPEQLRAFIGPAISGPQYQVGEEVVAALNRKHLAGLGVVSASVAGSGCAESGKYQVDLVAAARLALAQLGINDCSGGTWCTRADRRFYSHRRASLQARSHHGRSGELSEGVGQTGRQATLVWLTS